MAENCARAFGRYLKTLRERRELSLDAVCSLSQTFPEQINKGYLSRCENGHQKVAFVKVVPLSRIYEVPADVLVERMELDMELDRIGGPDTEQIPFAELTESGRRAVEQGYYWPAYGYLRDAVLRAPIDPVSDSFASRAEQCAIAQMSCGTAAKVLGRHRYALHEFVYLESLGVFSPRFRAIILERISACHRALRDLEAAEKFAGEAVREALSSEDTDYLGYAYMNQATIAWDLGRVDRATNLFRNAYDAYKKASRTTECVKSLINISQCYFDSARFVSARRASEAALRLAKENDLPRSEGLSLIMLGELDEIENRVEKAKSRWRDAVALAKALNERGLRFKAEFALFRRALRDKNMPAARAVARRLQKLAPWVSPDQRELEEFKRLRSTAIKSRAVARSQQPSPPSETPIL